MRCIWIAIIAVIMSSTPAMGSDVSYIGPSDEPGMYAWRVDGEVHYSAVSPDMAESAYNEVIFNGKIIFWGLIILVLGVVTIREIYRLKYEH